MKLGDLGEEGLIKLLSSIFRSDRCSGVAVSIGDDSAVLKMPGGGFLLVSTDTVLEKTHIPLEMTPEQIGAYAVNVALSDIAAMGGTPWGLVFSTVLPGSLDVDFAERIARGMEAAAGEHGTCIVGGDTQAGEDLTITGTAFGTAAEDGLMLRSGASPGDLICVTGELGSAAAGFYSLISGLTGHGHFIQRALEPKARLREGAAAARYASACMDISDGLALSLHEIGSKSGVGTMVHEDKIPVHRGLEAVAGEVGVSVRELVFYKGGDFELLLTVPSERLSALEKGFEKEGLNIFVIGEVTKHGHLLQTKDGETMAIEERGWQAFKGWQKTLKE
ncbi:MAG: thiamine-phosphate kinase [Methanobacteriota archaeon]|nr:MAG: thiamine-phosphate kinase [Euryarchaeota archaeon]